MTSKSYRLEFSFHGVVSDSIIVRYICRVSFTKLANYVYDNGMIRFLRQT